MLFQPHNKGSLMFAQLCQPLFPFLRRPHLALEYSGKVCHPSTAVFPSLQVPLFSDAFAFQATKIHQRTFGNDHPVTAKSLELMATVYAEIGKTEYSGKKSPGAAGIGPCWAKQHRRRAITVSVNSVVSVVAFSLKNGGGVFLT